MELMTGFNQIIHNINTRGGADAKRFLSPLVDVVDTTRYVKTAIEDMDLEVTPELLIGLTKLVLERECIEYNRNGEQNDE